MVQGRVDKESHLLGDAVQFEAISRYRKIAIDISLKTPVNLPNTLLTFAKTRNKKNLHLRTKSVQSYQKTKELLGPKGGP